MERSLTCGSLFSGIGGFCYGFEDAGFNTLWALDSDDDAVATYSLNFQHVDVVHENLIEFNRSKRRLPPVDVMHAGFPCQSFSQAGGRKGFDDPRGQLFFEIFKFVRNMGDDRPPVLLLENSPYLMWGKNGEWFDTVRLELQRAGYWFGPGNSPVIDGNRSGPGGL